MILVTGATGTVGREVVSLLVARGERVRAVSRTPATAGLPAGVEVVAGDLAEPASLAPQPESFWAVVERAVEASGAEWTFLRPVGFAANTLMWAGQIRAGDVVRWPYGAAARSLVHERDLAEVAVAALTSAGHSGARHLLSGPATLTQEEQVRAIGRAVGRDLRWSEMPLGEARQMLAAAFGDPDFAEIALRGWAAFVDHPEQVTDTVERITGHPARPYADWAADHADAFR
ncbi:NAD(P)H-binding protein [Micromonospora sp. 4G57]|uniref:NAD(P)H-binding protein n=1 Tax=Micromonospora sicca TaxID=2202420 RepID=A0ABU5J9F2_9ACTN|nr:MULTISPECIES: NAD(P)H-binding protein [unclassified Micromonospora]MDZ5441934.1 NAD(P)H-binding protein [Micromonospora sp. 4G57]MDZ5489213.1 NAD(P)H-binding protein [Micromonospora sp. 4G53]